MFTRPLAEFITRTCFQDIPQRVVERAKWAIFDYIGVAIAGSCESSGQIINELIQETNAAPEAVVIGKGYKNQLCVGRPCQRYVRTCAGL